jgi:hypothetical protein
MLVELTVRIVSGDPPNVAVAPDWKPVPVTVTEVPPSVDPPLGATEVTVGPGAR